MIGATVIDHSLVNCHQAITTIDVLRAWYGLSLDPNSLLLAPEGNLALILDR